MNTNHIEDTTKMTDAEHAQALAELKPVVRETLRNVILSTENLHLAAMAYRMMFGVDVMHLRVPVSDDEAEAIMKIRVKAGRMALG